MIALQVIVFGILVGISPGIIALFDGVKSEDDAVEWMANMDYDRRLLLGRIAITGGSIIILGAILAIAGWLHVYPFN